MEASMVEKSTMNKYHDETMQKLEDMSTKWIKISFKMKLDNDTVIDDLDITSRFEGCEIKDVEMEDV